MLKTERIPKQNEPGQAARTSSAESGQATIEFALTLIFMLSLIFFYVQLGLVMAFSNYAQYATFMAARAYMAAGSSQDDQLERASSVASKMLSTGGGGGDRWPTLARGKDGDQVRGVTIGNGGLYQEKNKNYSWQEGVRYSFRSRMFLLPGGAEGEAGAAIELTSESWLGREPNSSECSEYMTGVGGIVDNGC